MILESNLKTKIIALTLVMCYSTSLLADPVIGGEILPPAEALYVTDPSLLRDLNLGPDNEPVWCYSMLANSILISAADREKEKCQLSIKQEKQRSKTNCDFTIDQLNISMTSLKQRHEEILLLKNNQIEELTQAALSRPNDYSFWWASGGIVVGALVTLSIAVAIK